MVVQSRPAPSPPPPPPPPSSVGVASMSSGVGGVSEGGVAAEGGRGEEPGACDKGDREKEEEEDGKEMDGESSMPDAEPLLKHDSETQPLQMADSEQLKRKTSTSMSAPSKQLTLATLFAKQLKSAPLSQTLPPTSQSPATLSQDQSSWKKPPPNTHLPHLISSSLPPVVAAAATPKLSSVEEFVMGEEKVDGDLDRELTPLEQFQRKILRQFHPGSQHRIKDRREEGVVVRGEEGEGEGEGEGEEGREREEGTVGTLKPLIPDDVITKLKDKPGEIMFPFRCCS